MNKEEIKEVELEMVDQVFTIIKTRRKELGMSMSTLGSMTGLDKPSISRLEAFKIKCVRLGTIMKLCDALGLEVIVRRKVSK
jgi:DNA-binding Xre family transcriptional regulator